MRRDAARLRVSARAVGLDVDDLLQAGRLAALQAMPRWDASRGVQMATFLGRRARGGMLDEIERWHRMRQHDRMGLPAEEGRGPAEAAELAEDVARLRAALRRLPPADRWALWCRTRGWSHREIGDLLGASESVATDRWRHGCRRLPALVAGFRAAGAERHA